MFSNDDYVCICGKKKRSHNPTNWTRHISSCKVKQNKIKNLNISKFFKRPATSISTENSDTQTKKLRPEGKYKLHLGIKRLYI